MENPDRNSRTHKSLMNAINLKKSSAVSHNNYTVKNFKKSRRKFLSENLEANAHIILH